MPLSEILDECRPPLSKQGGAYCRKFTTSIQGVSFSRCMVVVPTKGDGWGEFMIEFRLASAKGILFSYTPEGRPISGHSVPPAAAAKMLDEAANGPKFQRISAKAEAMKTEFVKEWQKAEQIHKAKKRSAPGLMDKLKSKLG